MIRGTRQPVPGSCPYSKKLHSSNLPHESSRQVTVVFQLHYESEACIIIFLVSLHCSVSQN